MEAAIAAVLTREAERQAASGNHQDALDLLTMIEPRTAPVALLQGRILAQMGDFRKAEACFNEALASDPDSQDARDGQRVVASLSSSSFGGFRLRARAILTIAGALAVVGLLTWVIGDALISRRDLFASMRNLEVKVSELSTKASEVNKRAAIRLDHVEGFLAEQNQASVRTTDQLREQLARLQVKLGHAATVEQVDAVRAELVQTVKRLEAKPGQEERKP